VITVPDEDPFVAEYERRFEVLARIANDLHLSSDEAEQIIGDIILSTLRSRPIADIDTWLTAAFAAAMKHRGEHPC
jgi:anthranilate phosphoribosyltransferase